MQIPPSCCQKVLAAASDDSIISHLATFARLLVNPFFPRTADSTFGNREKMPNNVLHFRYRHESGTAEARSIEDVPFMRGDEARLAVMQREEALRF